TIHTENIEQEDALKAFAKALKIKFEVAKESPYDPDFVEKIKGDKDIAEGKGIKMTVEELKALCK
uniref:DUF2683 family protein n=1 Tax=Aquiflexum sp. TaxID=1872584 RepID=UPI003593D295